MEPERLAVSTAAKLAAILARQESWRESVAIRSAPTTDSRNGTTVKGGGCSKI
jgi:hypothetical protein